MVELKVDQDKCLGCGNCVVSCPVNGAISPESAGGHGPKTKEVIMMVENGLVKLFNVDKCTQCGTCPLFCPTDAIYLE